jgi:hypothetical protein
MPNPGQRLPRREGSDSGVSEVIGAAALGACAQVWGQEMTDATERAGLGKVIYSVDDRTDEPTQQEEREAQAEVREAIEESFPASDPPGFAGGNCSEPEKAS